MLYLFKIFGPTAIVLALVYSAASVPIIKSAFCKPLKCCNPCIGLVKFTPDVSTYIPILDTEPKSLCSCDTFIFLAALLGSVTDKLVPVVTSISAGVKTFPFASVIVLFLSPPLGTLRVLSPNFLSPPAVPSIFLVFSAEPFCATIVPSTTLSFAPFAVTIPFELGAFNVIVP